MKQAYFFDTYAIIEILKGSPAYAKYKYSKFIITVFNLVELHYKLLRDFEKRVANKVLHEYSDYIVDVDIETIIGANEYKLLHRQEKTVCTRRYRLYHGTKIRPEVSYRK